MSLFDTNEQEEYSISPVANISLIQLGDITPSKKSVEILAKKIHLGLKEGLLDPLDTAIMLKAMKEVCEQALKMCQNEIFDEIEKYGKGERPSKHNCYVEKGSKGEYDYSTDNVWTSIKTEEDSFKKKRAAREKLLKSIPEGKMIVDEATGETIYAPSKKETPYVKVTLYGEKDDA